MTPTTSQRSSGRMGVRITQLDGKLPNLALMRLSAWHRSQGDDVRWERGTSRQLHEPAYDVVYGSAIFATSAKAVALFRQQFPGAIVGGSGGDPDLRVNAELPADDKNGIPGPVPSQFTGLDYSGYPDFDASIGYTMRGCRFKCGFCVVPKQEGKARANATIAQVWRGEPFPKRLHLLDNDFFGNPDWRDVVAAINAGGFKVCVNQGINVRLLDAEQAAAMASMRVMDDQFKTRRIYTAWDNIGDEAVFFRGVDLLEAEGVNPDNLMVYMLLGYDPRETWDRIWHRYTRMMERKVRPYPMIHDRYRIEKPEHWRRLKLFQAWVIRGTHKTTPFEDFNASHHQTPARGGLLERMAA